MYIPFYNATETLFKTHFKPVKTIDYWNNQFDQTEKAKAVKYPAAYVEFENPINWTDAGNQVQQADTVIYIHLGVMDLSDKPTKIMELAQGAFKAIQGKTLTEGSIHISGKLTRNHTSLNSYEQIKEMVIGFKCTLYDYSNCPDNLTEVSPSLRITTERK